MSEPVKQIGYGEGIRKYSMNMEEYDTAYHHGFTAGVDESKKEKQDEIESLRKQVQELKKKRLKKIEDTWKDGYQCAEIDAFHGTQTTFKKSDSYKEQKNVK